MRKFAAHYLVSETGVFLKNGMAVAGEDGLIAQYIDTKGDLRESEQLIFHNGIIMAAFKFSKSNGSQPILAFEKTFHSLVLQEVAGSTQFSMQDFIDLGKELQLQFPGMKIPAIMNEMSKILITGGGFIKEFLPGIYLLVGADLSGLYFTPKSRLKKIF